MLFIFFSTKTLRYSFIAGHMRNNLCHSNMAFDFVRRIRHYDGRPHTGNIALSILQFDEYHCIPNVGFLSVNVTFENNVYWSGKSVFSILIFEYVFDKCFVVFRVLFLKVMQPKKWSSKWDFARVRLFSSAQNAAASNLKGLIIVPFVKDVFAKWITIVLGSIIVSAKTTKNILYYSRSVLDFFNYFYHILYMYNWIKSIDHYYIYNSANSAIIR